MTIVALIPVSTSVIPNRNKPISLPYSTDQLGEESQMLTFLPGETCRVFDDCLYRILPCPALFLGRGLSSLPHPTSGGRHYRRRCTRWYSNFDHHSHEAVVNPPLWMKERETYSARPVLVAISVVAAPVRSPLTSMDRNYQTLHATSSRPRTVRLQITVP